MGRIDLAIKADEIVSELTENLDYLEMEFKFFLSNLTLIVRSGSN